MCPVPEIQRSGKQAEILVPENKYSFSARKEEKMWFLKSTEESGSGKQENILVPEQYQRFWFWKHR